MVVEHGMRIKNIQIGNGGLLVQKAEIGNCLHGDIEANNFQLCAQLRVCSQAGGIPVYPRFSQPDNSESWDDAGNGI